MADGKLIIEVYEYLEDSPDVPPFEYIPCNLDSCLKKNKQCKLRELIEKGFDEMPKKNVDFAKRQEFLTKLDEADIGKISVEFHPASGDQDPYVELTNVVQVTMSYADARRVQTTNKEEIILYGRYKMTEGNDTTKLKDSQRLTLIYSSGAGEESADEESYDAEEPEVQKEICLNITYILG